MPVLEVFLMQSYILFVFFVAHLVYVNNKMINLDIMAYLVLFSDEQNGNCNNSFVWYLTLKVTYNFHSFVSAHLKDESVI